VTAPTEQPPAEQPAPPRLRRGQLVSFRHEDPILGGTYSDVGVVLVAGGDGEPVTVRPLARHDVLVDPGNVQPVSADDVAG
jgi:hypothetical protein